jgi:hypothetical protein
MTKEHDTTPSEETDKQRAKREAAEAEARHAYPRNMPEAPAEK